MQFVINFSHGTVKLDLRFIVEYQINFEIRFVKKRPKVPTLLIFNNDMFQIKALICVKIVIIIIIAV